ncbi:hypothetical protein AXF42_Ash021692 [Apostasia shenzhenica]|uniref:DDE Tnp4 domain-containing protein n=1 Tax=Apostasia shenzhenica TaxID=1088818 RepID=A0A2H9ZRM2_9ASPA|nr:hypothetical protein AXF42_Ash021692 [Apostasia shenzhenica]
MICAGKYYVVDSGYANTSKFLTSYRNIRYHIARFSSANSREYASMEEKVNHRHACLRNIVERTFGILKQRFRILSTMRPFLLETQRDVILACFVLHNFIAQYSMTDPIFTAPKMEEVESDANDVALTQLHEDAQDHSQVGDRHKGDRMRQHIARAIWEQRRH